MIILVCSNAHGGCGYTQTVGKFNVGQGAKYQCPMCQHVGATEPLTAENIPHAVKPHCVLAARELIKLADVGLYAPFGECGCQNLCGHEIDRRMGQEPVAAA
jgi:hypothetical protein